MNLLSLDKVSKSNGDKLLFENISFGIDEGQKAALIGVNGCGKSTLLKMIAGTEKTDSGTLSRNKQLRIGFLEQIPPYDPGQTVLDFIFREETPKSRLIKKYEAFTEKLHRHYDEKIQNELHRLIEEMESLKIWDYESEVQSMIKSLGIGDLTMLMGTLSGGMLKKVFLAQALIGESNMLLLDEPTNHLDMDTIQWLEEHLRKSRKAMIMVTHDRYFLDHVCNVLYEIDKKSLYCYQGNYTYYLEKKTEADELLEREEQKIEGILRKELEWLKRGPKARATKQKARIERITGMRDREKFEAEASVELSVRGRKLGNKILEVKNISKSFDTRMVIKPFSHTFKHREKIGFLGPNGSGKTTLLNLITGRLDPDTGTVEKGVHTHFGYFDQHSSDLKPDQTLIDYVKSSAEFIDLGGGNLISASQLLERFLFPKKTHYTLTGLLSGGEKRRLYLLSILMKNPNFLVLDEPTNDLDLKTLSVLEDFLTGFGGCLILISHDRYFLDRTVDTLFLFDGQGNIDGYPGSCSDYLEELKLEKEEQELKKETEKSKEVQPVKKKPAGLTYKEKQELEKLPHEIESLETEKSSLEANFATGEYDPLKLKDWNTRLEEIRKALEEKYARWEDLMAKE
jgi:ABC transport system ATP-binding/permease protein